MAIRGPETKWLERPGGRIAYDVRGAGPLVVCLPGMGDLRQAYRFLAPRLAEAGYRVATMDVRGLGESSARWDDYGQRAMGEDALALVERLGGPAVIVGHSFTTDAAVWAAVQAPERVVGTVLLGPWARPVELPAWKDWALRRMLRSPWLWSLFYRSLYPGEKTADFADYLRALRNGLAAPERRDAFARIASPEATDARSVRDRLERPALIVMGERDPDFRDPREEAEAMRTALSRAQAEVVMIADCGHYPHAQRPEPTAAAMLAFMQRIGHVAGGENGTRAEP